MIEQCDPETLLAGGLGEWLEAQHTVREDARAKTRKRWWIVGPGLVLSIPIWLFLAGITGGIVLPLAFASVIAGSWWAQRPTSKARRDVKVGINSAIARAVGLDYADTGDKDPEYAIAKRYKMLPGHDRTGVEDFWSGAIGGRAFRLFELHLQRQHRSNNGNTTYRTVFRGAIMRFGLARPFHATTLLQRDGAHRSFFIGRRKDRIRLDGQDLGCVDMVSPDFEDVFDLYSTDPVEARYLVDPVYCEKLIEIERAFDGSDIRTLFHDGQLLVVMEGGDKFESGSMDSSDDHVLLEKTCQQFNSLTGLARALDRPERGAP